MMTLLQHRQREVKALYREKELVDVILTMCGKLEEHMTGKETALIDFTILIC